MGVYFSISHNNGFVDETIEHNSSTDRFEQDSNNSEINRNIRSKTAMLFKFHEENKRDSDNPTKRETSTFLPLSFIEFVQRRPVSFSNTPIVVIEGVPQSIQSLSRRSHKQKQQSNYIENNQESTTEHNESMSSYHLKEIIPDLPQKFSYKSLNRELHQNFEISQYKVNAVRIWILKSNSIRERTMTKAVECCRHFDFTSYISNQYVRVENVFSDVKSNDFQSLASALRPQEFSNLSNSPPNQKKASKDTGSANLKSTLNIKSDNLGDITDFSKTAPLSIPKYLDKSEKKKIMNFQIDTSSSNVEAPKSQDTSKHRPLLGTSNLELLSTSPTSSKVGNLSENSSGNSSENLSENLSENSPDILSETSSEISLHSSNQSSCIFSSPSGKPNSISLLPLKIPTITPERSCFSSRRPCEINCNNNFSNDIEISQFSSDEEFITYSCSSEDARIKFRYRHSNECDMVIPGLFIGGEKAAHDKKLLRSLKITHIVNLNFNETGGGHADESGKELYDDEMEDDSPTNESNSSISSGFRFQDSEITSPFKIDQSIQSPLQQKSKRQIFNLSPRSKQIFSPQGQPGKNLSPRSIESFSPRNDHDNDNNNHNIQKDSNKNESENQSSGPGSFKMGRISRFNVRLSDSVFQDLNEDFWGALHFVEQAIHSGGNVLAHCRRGISRSAALCVAYLMDDRGMSFDDAFALLKRQRPSVNINQGFEDQLRVFYNTVKEKKKEEKEF
ncbi:hypothetical protein M9Y10_022157 [Tritrichomonas musculus]|uniref:Dual specificity phosphatase, catalytic domain containing protein n=1 Tax=Tritrichomonas musculus TaxID=1915356 RepID=A0ABR2KRQ9_9EUKA